MELTKCKICGYDLEEMAYGHTEWINERSPYDLPICYDCLKKIKKELDKLNVED